MTIMVTYKSALASGSLVLSTESYDLCGRGLKWFSISTWESTFILVSRKKGDIFLLLWLKYQVTVTLWSTSAYLALALVTWNETSYLHSVYIRFIVHSMAKRGSPETKKEQEHRAEAPHSCVSILPQLFNSCVSQGRAVYSLNLTFLVSRTVMPIVTNGREAWEIIYGEVSSPRQAFRRMPRCVMRKGSNWSGQWIFHEYPQCGEILNTTANETDIGSAPNRTTVHWGSKTEKDIAHNDWVLALCKALFWELQIEQLI